MTFEMGTPLATALIYLMISIKENALNEWSACPADNLHFYKKFPVYRRDFGQLQGKNCIAALDLSSTVESLVDPRCGNGQSEIRPLTIQVLADRKSCVFVETPTSSNLTLAFGNVFKFSGCLILRSEWTCNGLFCFERLTSHR